MKNYIKENGITLIALVITIVILLILAGVSIDVVFGDNGILNRSKLASKEYKEQAANEKLQLILSNFNLERIEEGKESKLEDLEELNNSEITIKKDGDVIDIKEQEDERYAIAYIDGYEFKIYDNYKVEVNGKKEISEFEKLQNSYIQNGLLVWYDGKYNTRSGHSNNTAKWENLANIDNKEIYDGTLMNISENSDISGWTDNSLLIDGSNDWVKMMYISDTNITVEIVAKPKNIVSGNYQYFIANCQDGGMSIIKGKNDKVTSEMYLGGSYRYLSSNKTIEKDKIYSISTCYNSEEGKRYLKENDIIYEEDLDKDLNFKLPNNSTIFAIGTNPNGSSEEINSDERRITLEVYSVRIYNRILTNDEMQKNYASDATRFNM